MATARWRTKLSLATCVLAIAGCGDRLPDAEKLLAKVQLAARQPDGKCKLTGTQDDDSTRLARLAQVTAKDVLSVTRAEYVEGNPVELLIRAPNKQSPHLVVFVFVKGGRCERFDLADMWEDTG